MLIVMMKDDDYDYVVDAFTYDATHADCGRKKKQVESQSTAICASAASC